MFLLNMFSRTKSDQEEKFDRISFKIDLNQNMPQFYDWDGHTIEEEEEITPFHPLYYQLFPQNKIKYAQYVVNQNDTLDGIAFKLDINQATIRQINSISGNIYPGMTILLPEESDLTKLTETPSQKLNSITMGQLLTPSQKLLPDFASHKYPVSYYAGVSGGYIRGNLTLNTNYLIFNPSLDDKNNIAKFTIEKLLKFNAIVEIADIQDAAFMDIPEMGDAEIPNMISVVQFMLYRVGNTKVEQRYSERLKQLRLDHKAIASMSLSAHGSQEKTSHQIAEELVAKIREMIVTVPQNEEEGDDKNRLTRVPFFDIIHANIQPRIQVPHSELNRVIAPNTILGILSEPSDIITPEQFSNLVVSMPVIYQLYNWTKVYGSTRDGSSFTTFLNRTMNVEPALLLIKEHKGYTLGAFLIQNIQTGKTGRGEMFIFTFRDQTTPEVYQWTGKNEQFVYIEMDKGIGIGMGFKYGIFIKNDLDKGSSSSTFTFGNTEILSKKEDFFINQIEVWGTELPY